MKKAIIAMNPKCIDIEGEAPSPLMAAALKDERIRKTAAVYPMRVSAYYAGLIRGKADPIWLQAVADPAELDPSGDAPDPLCEQAQSPVPGIVHRYPDRVVFLVSNRCAVYCRHCMRKRKVGEKAAIAPDLIEEGIAYIRNTPSIADVIVSGGDPLMLDDDAISGIAGRLRAIPHVEIIRIHTRVPCTLPQRVTHELAERLARFHPLWINTQFNHPMELTAQAAAACAILSDAGIGLGCQTVLLKGVNDTPETMMELMRGLLRMRVRPYYLHHPDRVRGTRHFWPSVETGLEIMACLRGNLSGMGVPQYMIDLPGGGGKVPLLPEYILEKGDRIWRIRNFQGRVFEYPV